MSSKKDRISESKLIKALAELEAIAKGDPLESADPEGGLSTEGEPLSSAAPRGKGETKKSRNRESASSPFGASSSSSAASSDDDGSGGDDASSPPFPPKKGKKEEKDGKSKKGGKVSKAAKSTASSSSDDDDGSDDDGSDDAEKSFRELAEGDETMRKGIRVNDFLESMVDQMSLALLHVKKSISNSLQEMEVRLTAHIDENIAKSDAGRQGFNVRLAKALAAIGNTVQNDLVPVVDMVKALADQPVGSGRGKAILSKGEINRPPWGGPASGDDDRRVAGGPDGDEAELLRGLGTKAIADWMFKKSATNQLDQNVILAFEADRYDPAMLPPAVRKALVDDLVK